ncbi:hypothetical protein [Nitrosomonas communis]|uniref:Transposase DDE domain-containing protein n=1 Tax=Nitrosomonas communis TaxID=44574 RepID=A0A1I4VI91_9PROT|nr:hypothetical protein [Nitrosomonas communis]SFN00875.1 hypothetical protein SAMN05421863_10844 [Nitrosomonas communis]
MLSPRKPLLPSSLPIRAYIGVTGTNDYDAIIFDQIRPQLHSNELYSNKAYQQPNAQDARQARNLTVLTLVKKQKGQHCPEPQDQWLSTAVFCVRHRLKHYLPGLKKRQALNVPVKFVLINLTKSA